MKWTLSKYTGTNKIIARQRFDDHARRETDGLINEIFELAREYPNYRAVEASRTVNASEFSYIFEIIMEPKREEEGI